MQIPAPDNEGAHVDILRHAESSGRTEELLRAIIEGTSPVTGTALFRALVQHLTKALGVRYSFVAECLPNLRARSRAFWCGDDFGEDFEYDLPGTPCMEVAQGRTCHYPDRIPELFPEDTGMIDLGTRSYLGVPLLDSSQRTIGHLVIFDTKPMPADPLTLSIMEMFAGRAGAELERVQAYEQLQSRDQELKALLDVNVAISRHLERDELFAALATCLRNLLETDRFGIELPFDGDKLQGHILTALDGAAKPTKPTILPAAGTACDWVIQNRQWFVTSSSDELRERFPVTFDVMFQQQMESLCALPLATSERCLGALFFMTAKRTAYKGLRRGLLDQVAAAVAVALDDCLAHEEARQLRDELAARKVAELEQQKRHISDQLQQVHEALKASEERFRDLFEEAPIAYVHEGLDSRFIRANRAALRILGVKPEEAVGTIGKTLVADTPDNQRRLHEAFESIGRGTDTGGVVLEMRRKDNGKPVWIQWWSRPDPSGKYTRTMFIDITERVLMEREKTRLEAQNTYLQEEIRAEHNFVEIVGNSPKLRAVLQQVEQVAPTDSTVLIYGETGTGKELIARAIHDRSRRKNRPLIKVNCGAISAGLVESELFGHVKGAFTGALTNRDGRFKVADGGTIFLDEVGELPPETQVKLLRVLQEHEFEPIGSDRTVKVDVRIIAATNRNLDDGVRAGKFRPDLLYRLNVFPVHVPSLRERQDDVPLLVTFFLQTYAKKLGKKVKQVSEETMRRLMSYSWPGNIRELQNIIERAVILSAGDVLVLDREFQPSATGSVPVVRETSFMPATEAGHSLEAAERRHIESILAQVNWVIEGDRGAARLLKLHPNTLRSRMKKLGIQRPSA
jgi:formate hydrogenlyase transcriptional activator